MEHIWELYESCDVQVFVLLFVLTCDAGGDLSCDSSQVDFEGKSTPCHCNIICRAVSPVIVDAHMCSSYDLKWLEQRILI